MQVMYERCGLCPWQGARRVGFKEFESSFQMLAEERGCSLDDVRALIAACGGPRANGVTTADAVRLHDDKSTYTGLLRILHSALISVADLSRI